MSELSPSRTIQNLKELRALTGDEAGAQRVAFTKTWVKARAWLKDRLAGLPVHVRQDEAGNLWATLAGETDDALLIGGHIDSVPNGGWLDGCLNLLAGLEVLRRIAAEYAGRPPITVRLVDWADEEGARFGRSLFGSSAAVGDLRLEEIRGLRDADGITLPDALRACGIDLDRAEEARCEMRHAQAYLELHVEQGPVLEDLDLPLGAVLGTFGIERHAIRFKGQAAHAGSTPMDRRRDAFLAAGRMAQEIYTIAGRHDGVCTIGRCVTEPGIATSVVEDCLITLDQRHLDAARLAQMWQQGLDAARRFAGEGRLEMDVRPLWRLEPVSFHPDLIELCEQAIIETCGRSHRLPSGPLHDAAQVARAGVPTVMVFVQSLRGISHNKIEDTKEEHLELAVVALDRLATKAMRWITTTEGAPAAA
jgi:hydantoinase/carbamoylase family amidase